LPKLRVAADWRARRERSHAEVAWLSLVAGIDPRRAPQVLGEDRAHFLFAMEYLPPERHPLWKSQLSAGRVDAGFAAAVGRALSQIHAATAGRNGVAQAFDNGADFHALRVEPYFLHAARRNPDCAAAIGEIAARLASTRIALMQGDISPKNILCGPDGPVFLDAETASYGDPAFDLAFCLNHLLLKAVWRRQYRDRFAGAFKDLHAAYLRGASWEDAAAIDARTGRLLAALLLARVDGKSPVEYLTSDCDKAFVRDRAKRFLSDASLRPLEILEQWMAGLAQDA
jgi:tRNA A-37 threonylcarbamoyl transferase component Bud32